MDKTKLDESRVAKPEVLALIEKLATSGEVKQAHYFGYAHETVLRLLLKHLSWRTRAVRPLVIRTTTGVLWGIAHWASGEGAFQ